MRADRAPAAGAPRAEAADRDFSAVRLAHLPGNTRPRFDRWGAALFGDLQLPPATAAADSPLPDTPAELPDRGSDAAGEGGSAAPGPGPGPVGAAALQIGTVKDGAAALADVAAAARAYHRGVLRNPLHLQIVPLIQQFLAEMGWGATLQALEADSGLAYRHGAYVHGSLLLQILQYAWATQLTPAPAADAIPTPASPSATGPKDPPKGGTAPAPREQAVAARLAPLTRPLGSLKGHGGPVLSVVVARGRQGQSWVLTGAGDGALRFWALATQQLAGTVQLYKGAGVAHLMLEPGRQRRYVAAGGMNGSVLLLDVWAVLEAIAERGDAATAGPGTGAADADEPATLPPILDLQGPAARKGLIISVLTLGKRPRRFVVALAWAPGGTLLAAATYDGTWYLYRLATPTPGPGPPVPELVCQETLHDTVAEALCFVDAGQNPAGQPPAPGRALGTGCPGGGGGGNGGGGGGDHGCAADARALHGGPRQQPPRLAAAPARPDGPARAP